MSTPAASDEAKILTSSSFKKAFFWICFNEISRLYKPDEDLHWVNIYHPEIKFVMQAHGKQHSAKKYLRGYIELSEKVSQLRIYQILSVESRHEVYFPKLQQSLEEFRAELLTDSEFRQFGVFPKDN